ncbi:hypothetical protein EVAR_47437_1 [Eumeta japonica]|uniref:Uncharacterized protein n=1 Tax=Eumeta variegata TaxID=151549 RepID=A0A4C1XEF5_EUMVA|nr:hypothetical protein EVAR_47437_1 [Eumeta japonica]
MSPTLPLMFLLLFKAITRKPRIEQLGYQDGRAHLDHPVTAGALWSFSDGRRRFDAFPEMTREWLKT